MTAILLLAVMMAVLSDGEPKALVVQLSSPRSADRDQAESALIAMGDRSLPALAAAADTTNLELRAKIAQLRDSIEGSRLIKPTLLALDLDGVSPRVGAEAIGKKIGATLIVNEDPSVHPGEKIAPRRVTIREKEPIPLWEVVDQFCAQSSLRLEKPLNPLLRQRQFVVDQQDRRRRPLNGNEWIFVAKDSKLDTPNSDWGAIRTSLLGLTLDRSRNFARTPETANQPEATTRFSVTFQVRSEPKIRIAAIEQLRVDEAIDANGQVLLPVGTPLQVPSYGQVPVQEMTESQPFVIHLNYPQNPGASITILKGTFRALVVGRRIDAIVIPLVGELGKSIMAEGVSITAHRANVQAGGRDMIADFSVHSVAGFGPSGQFVNPSDARSALRPPPSARGQLEFVDANGQTCQIVDLATSNNGRIVSGATQRVTLMISSAPGTGPPIEARYYQPAWSSQVVPFSFRDIPMP